MVALDLSQSSHLSRSLLQLNFLDNLVNSLQGGEGGTLYSFCTAQCPATRWAHRSTGKVLCQLAGKKSECADMKRRHCTWQKVETGVWGTGVGRGGGKKGTQGAWHARKTGFDAGK